MHSVHNTTARNVVFLIAVLVSGTILPALTGVFFSYSLANPIWSFFFSIGFQLADWIFADPGFGNLGFVYAVWGILIWPICLIGALSLLLFKATSNPLATLIGYGLIALSLFLVTSVEARNRYFGYLPQFDYYVR